MIHSLQCRCGTLKGRVCRSHVANRCVCYCRDCQAFAHFLGRADEILGCNTPVGNTLANSKVSFVGLVHNCLEGAGPTLDDSFGPVQAHVNTQSAKGGLKSSPLALVAVILRFIAIVAGARMDGSYKRSPFFAADTGAPIVTPKVLSPGEREQLMSAV
jgi:hypothetical protein